MIEIFADIVVGVCVFALFVSILINFVEKNRAKVKKEKNSIVETGSMTLFFFAFYIVIRFNIGDIEMSDAPMKIILAILGLLLLVFGCIVNIVGRFNLGKNWGNQIKIYKNHTLVRTGMYAVVRHPLYSSIILMFFGASVAYFNYMSFLMNVFVFIPFMYYRASQEEKVLIKTFKEYKEYQREVGMLFPKLIK